MSRHAKHQIRMTMLGLALAMTVPIDAAAQSPAAGPDEAACQGKQDGDACTLINGTAGACGPGTCSRLDYSQGSPPKATEEPCTVCVAGAAPNPPPLGTTETTTDASPASGGAEANSGEGEAKASEDEPPQSASRCSVMDRSEPSDLGWLGLLVMGLVVGRRMRRSR
jgi:MYXO-CTERM domain-containing protein